MQKKRSNHAVISFGKKISQVILGVFLFFLFLEAGLRAEGLAMRWLRDQGNLRSLKEGGAYRIMCIGESTTMNQYPQYLAEALNRRRSGVNFSAIDKGIAAGDTAEILAWLERDLDACRPNMVVAMMGINDTSRCISDESAPVPKPLLFLRSLRVYNLAGAIRRMIFPLGPVNDLRDGLLSVKPAGPLPVTHPAYLESGKLLRKQFKFLQAEAVFKQAQAFDPESDQPYIESGRLYRDWGRFPQAEEAFKRAIELNPGNYSICAELGALYVTMKKPVQAEEFLKKSIILEPRQPQVYLELTELYRREGRLLEAAALLDEGMRHNPDNDNLRAALTVLYMEMGDARLAREQNRKVDEARSRCGNLMTRINYQRLKAALDKRKIKLVCAQYPMRGVEPLKKIFSGQDGVIFVDNERVFKDAVKREGYNAYFRDMYGGDFGHCTDKGNRLLAANIAEAILKWAR